MNGRFGTCAACKAHLDRTVTKRRFFGLIILANALVWAGGWFYWERVHSKAAAPGPSEAGEDVPLVEVKANRPKPGGVASDAPSAVVIQTNAFHWRQVESADYRTYVANLRGIGCPEATIKDIILTDIMKLFAERRGQFYQNGREFKFWETREKHALTARQMEERDKQLAKIDKEVPSVLRELLGVNYDREINKYFVDNREDERRLSFVSEEKRRQLLALREELEGLKEHLLDQAQNGQPMDLNGLKKIQEHRKEALSQILTPEERDEFELRTSETAERLRTELVGFNPSEQEFREIYQLWQAHDEKFAFVSADDASAAKAKEQDRQRIEQELKSKLELPRVVDYDRARNPDYQLLSTLTERYELPQATAQAVFEIKQIAENARQSLLAQKSLGEAERLAAMKAIQEETQRAVRQNLGDKLFPVYARNGGTWIEGLGPGDSPAK
jgi:hypothetical protein